MYWLLPKSENLSHNQVLEILILIFCMSIGRMIRITRDVSKFPTYRGRFCQIVKTMVAYTSERELPIEGNSTRSINDATNTV